jgi:3-oxoacyl-[acyl-carrier-protein] synthase II
MNPAQRRVVITGVGAVTPLGTGNDLYWQALTAGRSGVRPLESFTVDGIATRIAAEVRDFDPKNYVKHRKSLKVMARDIQLGVGAAHLVVEDAGLDTERVDPTRFGVNCGAGLIATELDELGAPVSESMNGGRHFDLRRWGVKGMEQLFPLWMLKYLPNMPACHISIMYNAQGPNNSITAGEASATLAIGEAFRVIERDGADLFIAGGTDSKIHPLGFVRLALLDRLTRRNDDPAKASRPFDVGHDGLVAGEAAGLVVLETLEHARARGAGTIYGEVIAFGSSCHPNLGQAVAKAVTWALKEAKLSPGGLGHIAATGTSCAADDRAEARALAEVLGDAVTRVPVVAYKSYLGYTGAASGAVELIASLLAMRHGMLPGTLNFERPDPLAPTLRVSAQPNDFPKKPFLAYSVSLAGQCGAIIVRPFV